MHACLLETTGGIRAKATLATGRTQDSLSVRPSLPPDRCGGRRAVATAAQKPGALWRAALELDANFYDAHGTCSLLMLASAAARLRGKRFFADFNNIIVVARGGPKTRRRAARSPLRAGRRQTGGARGRGGAARAGTGRLPRACGLAGPRDGDPATAHGRRTRGGADPSRLATIDSPTGRQSPETKQSVSPERDGQYDPGPVSVGRRQLSRFSIWIPVQLQVSS